MNRNYDSIDKLFTEDKNWIIEQLNGQKTYYQTIKRCKYTKIGVIVQDNSGKEIGRYASNNNIDGKISEIVGETEFGDPNIVVAVKEKVLLEIVNKREYVKAHPIESLIKYGKEFKFITGNYWDIFTRALGFDRNLKSGDAGI